MTIQEVIRKQAEVEKTKKQLVDEHEAKRKSMQAEMEGVDTYLAQLSRYREFHRRGLDCDRISLAESIIHVAGNGQHVAQQKIVDLIQMAIDDLCSEKPVLLAPGRIFKTIKNGQEVIFRIWVDDEFTKKRKLTQKQLDAVIYYLSNFAAVYFSHAD